MLYVEFWYIIIFFNWPNLTIKNNNKIKQLLQSFKEKYLKGIPQKNIDKYIPEIYTLTPIINFIEQFNTTNNHHFFNWQIDIYKSISQAITYRTLQRTLFQQYKGIHGLEIFGSIN